MKCLDRMLDGACCELPKGHEGTHADAAGNRWIPAAFAFHLFAIARAAGAGQWAITCPTCGRENTHGALEGERVAHCNCPGYYLVAPEHGPALVARSLPFGFRPNLWRDPGIELPRELAALVLAQSPDAFEIGSYCTDGGGRGYWASGDVELKRPPWSWASGDVELERPPWRWAYVSDLGLPR